MALQLSYNTNFGITLSEAYAKISTYNGTKDCVVVNVDFFATQAARDTGSPSVGHQSYQLNNDEANFENVSDCDSFVSALYVWLKTQTGFEDAIDV